MSQCVLMCCSVFVRKDTLAGAMCVAVCCSVLHCVAVPVQLVSQCVTVLSMPHCQCNLCCSVLKCVAVCCSVSQYFAIALCCSMLFLEEILASAISQKSSRCPSDYTKITIKLTCENIHQETAIFRLCPRWQSFC